MNELEEGHDTNLPLHALAKRDGVVFVVVDRAIADGMRDFGEPIRMRIRRDKYDGRLRHFDIAPASSHIEQPHRRPRGARRPPERTSRG